jgi:acetyl esterase/lipase
MKQKLMKVIGIAVFCLLACLALLGGLGQITTQTAQAQGAATAAKLYLPVAACPDCKGAVSTPTPGPSPTATPSPTPSVLRPALVERYGVTVTQGLVYGEAQVTMSNTVTTTKLLLDLYEPVGAPAIKRPVIVMVHGGAFVRGSRQEANQVRAANGYAARGYVVAAISYRLGGGPTFATTGKVGPMPVVSARVRAYQDLVNGVESIRFLDFITNTATLAALNPLVRLGQAAALDDTLTAIDWLGSQAESRRLDLSRLAMFGGSAGSITSLHAAYALDDLGIPAPPIAAVIDHWGSFNLDDSAVLTDGVTFMETGEAPLFIVHGTSDVEVPFTFGQAIFNRANGIGVPVEFNPVQGGVHGFNGINIFTTQANNGQTLFQRSVEFLDQALFDSDVLRPALTPVYATKVTTGTVYGVAQVTMSNTVTNTNLLLDLYEPVDAPAGRRPVIVMVHGGAFVRGSRQEANQVNAAKEYAARGYVVAAISYRLGGGPTFAATGKVGPMPVVSARVRAYQDLVNGVESIRFLDFITNTATLAALNPLVRLGQAAALDDTLTALAWLGSQANSRSLDMSRVVMFGGSAGAITSLHAAYALDDLGIPAPPIAAVLDHWGAFNLDDSDVLTDGVIFMETGEAPLLIVHGTNDVEVPFTFGQAIRDRAVAIGVPVEFNPVQGGVHGFNGINIFTTLASNGQTLYQRTIEFLDDQLFPQEIVVMAQ